MPKLKKPLSIVYCTDRYWPAHGGAETYIRTVAQEMAKDHTVKVVTIVRDERSLNDTLCRPNLDLGHHLNTDGAIQIVTLELSLFKRAMSYILHLEGITHRLFNQNYYFVRSLWLRYVAQLLAQPLDREIKGFDIVHSVAPWEISHSVNLVRRNIPHVITGLLHPGHWADDPYSLEHFRMCDHIIALSDTENQAYQRFHIPEQKISVVGVPVIKPEIYEYELPEAILVDTNSPIILFLGVKREYKGIDILLKATKHVWKIIPDAQFVFAGPRTDYSKALFSRTNPDPRIIEIDAVSETEKWSLLRQCDFVCLPSETEIMPNVILEAWLMHKTVITSDIPTLKEFVGDAGICTKRDVLALSNGIISLLQNPALSWQLAECGWNKCQVRHSEASVKSELERVYYELLDRDSDALAE